MMKMKVWRLFGLLFMLLSISVTVSAQLKKPKPAVTEENTAIVGKNDLQLNLMPVFDTAKVRIIAYMQDDVGINTLTWLNGYVVGATYVPKVKDEKTSELKIPSGVTIFDSNWKLLRAEDVFDVRKLNWPDKK